MVSPQNKNSTRKLFTALSIALALAFVPVTANATSVTELNEQIKQNQENANALAGKADTLANKIAELNNQVASLSSQIAANKAKSESLSKEIIATKDQLALKKQVLDENVRVIYQQSKVSPLEMLASSKSFSEYVDRQQYLDTLKDHVQESAKAVKMQQEKLERQQEDLDQALKNQVIQQANLAASRQEQANLLSQTKGDEANYRNLANQQAAQRDRMVAEQAAAARRLLGGGATSGAIGSFEFKNLSGLSPCGGGGYNLCHDGVDRWDLYTKQCVSYAAWAVENRFGKAVPRFAGRGHAYQWPSTLAGKGFTVNNTPAVGSVAIAAQSGNLPYGHAMVVEQVYGNGWVKVSQYNFGYPVEMYSTMDVKATGVVFIHF